MYRLITIGIALILSTVSCNTLKNSYLSKESLDWEENQPVSEVVEHTIYVFGEMGRVPIDKNPLAPIIQKELASADENTTALFLGSHLYPKGLSGKSKAKRPEQEAELLAKFALLDNYAGSYYFIAGEHDWEYRGDKGLKAVKRMEDFFEDNLEQKDLFLPEKGCGEPYKLKVKDDIVLLFLNTQWWLEDWENESKINKGCEVKSRTEMVDELRELMLKNKNKRLVIAMHHPLFSDGEHGGNIPAKKHLVPLPLIGSAVAGHRKITGFKQDLNHPKFQMLKEEIMLIGAKDVIYVAAHDYSLQYFHEANQHFIVSGSAGGNGFARKGGNAEFASAKAGFSKIVFYENKEVWTEFYGLENGKLQLLYKTLLRKGKPEVEDVLAKYEFKEIPDSVVTVAASTYAAKKFKRFWLGSNYRDIWTLPVNINAVDISKERGGLTPLKKGGGTQTNSLRCEAPNGNQVVFRSIFKSAAGVTPEFAQSTWVENILQDGMSGAHPYGAVVMPGLSRAANIYYTEPQLAYIPKQPGLGIYNESFGEQIYIYEDRPTGNREDFDGFGNSKKIIGINDLLPKLQNDHDHQVDEQWTLRSRLFDIWVHDWDRHDDQWRWASFKKGDKTIYRPIPRDRDQVFWTFNGVLNYIVSNLAIVKFKTYKAHLKKPQLQSVNAKNFDRAFLTRMELDDWLQEAEFLQSQMTDSVIQEAFKALPANVYADRGDEIIAKLKSRRADLPEIAEKMYKWLAKRVKVMGTNDDDLFEVHRNPDGSTIVRVFDLSKKGKKKDMYFSRTFHSEETKDIILHGLGGDDEYVFTGKSYKGINVRIIGGSGKDKVENTSEVYGARRMLKIYDEKDGIKFQAEDDVQDRTSNNYEVNDYEREEFKYNFHLPTFIFGSNIDDGFFLGAGMTSMIHGFRTSPYKALHNFNFSVSPSTKAFNAFYSLHRVGTFHNLNSDLVVEMEVLNPSYVNYYGRGNETVFDQTKSSNYYWVRLREYNATVGLGKDWLHGRYSLKVLPQYRSSKVIVVDGRVSEEPSLGLTADDKERKHFLGGSVEGSINAIEMEGARSVNGMAINFGAGYFNQVGDGDHYSKFEADMTYFVTFFKRKLPTTIGTRVGAAAEWGDVPFYQSSTIGGDNYLRGFRGQRYSGSYLFYQNIDLRVQLAYWDNKILPFGIGLLGGFDYGRIWEPGDNSKVMHKSYTAGLWMTPFTIIGLSFNYSFGEEENLFAFGMGFFF